MDKKFIPNFNLYVTFLIYCLNIMEEFFLSPYLILAIAAILGLFMAWGIGANDVANAMGTSVGSKA
ncbi:MAG: hypothetical protein CM15mP127_02400 [Gammaproteobacteria bacterium]|nr:MAG: hypothetical protein CM15mP127_02400 [Gammaproteobacteria bacterium]